MIIVSQDKERIVNLDSLLHIFIHKPNSLNEICYGIIDGKSGTLGNYETEERAKEVLQDIIKFYEISKRFEFSYSPNLFFEKRFTYEMPED